MTIATTKMRKRCSRGNRLSALCITALLILSAPCRSQTLRLGDPRPPTADEMPGGREQARQLRTQADALRAQASHADDREQPIKLAQARWREVAAWLLDQPDSLAQPRVVLLGWSLAQQEEALDRAIAQVVQSDSLSAEQRDEALWNLRRFAASEIPSPATQAATDDTPAAQIRAVIRPLVEALSIAGNGPAPDALLHDRLAVDRAFIADDPDLAPLATAIDRCEELAAHAGWRIEAQWSLRALLEFVESVRQLDKAGWLGPAWQPHRAAAIAAAIQLMTEPGDARTGRAAQRVGEMARCVAQFDDLALLAPTSRPRLDAYRSVVARWVSEPISDDHRPPWDMLSEAFEAMAQRRASPTMPTQRELRLVCAALDDQSDQLERMMARWFARETPEDHRSDPQWVTVIGQHRENTRDRQVLLDLPAAIDLLNQYDPRSSAAIWKRLLPDARAVADPIVREALLAATQSMTGLPTRHSTMPLETEWRADAPWLAPLVGTLRVGVLARLDTLRKMRAAELTAGQPLPATEAELDAMRDLFRLVVIWRQLQFPAPNDAQSVPCPLGLATQEAQRLDSVLRRLLDQAASGSVLFTRAVDSARQDVAGAVVVAALMTSDVRAAQPSSPALGPLLAIAGSIDWERESGDVSRQRLAQWCVLQVEAAQGREEIASYLRFLCVRIADAYWAASD